MKLTGSDNKSELKLETHSRCFLDDLLMTSLYTAVSLKQVDVVAVSVTKYLHFHMPDRNTTSAPVVSHLI